MRYTRSTFVFASLGMLFLAGCAGVADNAAVGDSDGSTPPATIASSDATTSPTTGPATSTTDAADPTDVTITTDTETTTPATLAPALIEELPGVELLSPETITSERAPQFEWAGVDGAAAYRLVVIGPAGPIWSWEGSATTVRLGGLAADRPPAFGGPEIVPGTTWTVTAIDAAGTPLAASAHRSLGPG